MVRARRMDINNAEEVGLDRVFFRAFIRTDGVVKIRSGCQPRSSSVLAIISCYDRSWNSIGVVFK